MYVPLKFVSNVVVISKYSAEKETILFETIE